MTTTSEWIEKAEGDFRTALSGILTFFQFLVIQTPTVQLSDRLPPIRAIRS